MFRRRARAEPTLDDFLDAPDSAPICATAPDSTVSRREDAIARERAGRALFAMRDHGFKTGLDLFASTVTNGKVALEWSRLFERDRDKWRAAAARRAFAELY